MQFDPPQIDIEKGVTKQECFSDLVYTPFLEAKEELRRRRDNKALTNRIREYFGSDIPEVLFHGPKGLLFRQLVTPNYEFRRFMNIVHAQHIDPLFFEYHEDKFTSQNPLKHALGKMRFITEGKSFNSRIRTKTIIDFNKSEGKRITDVYTIWGQKLIDFHHVLIEKDNEDCHRFYFDASQWFQRGGTKASKYYERYIALCVQHAILFENFILSDDSEFNFIENIFLPAFINISKTLGYKPLIVPLLPMATQSNPYWFSYPIEMLSFLYEANMVK
jgi:hypothetical protein